MRTFLITLLLSIVAANAATNKVTVAWDPNPEPDIAEYRIYYGVTASGVTNSIAVGTATQGDVLPLWGGLEYWFFVTAKNTAGLESDPSTVLLYETPAIKPNAPTGLVLTFELLTSTDVIGPFTNRVQFVMSEPIKFYLAEVPPKLTFETNDLSSANFVLPPLPSR